VEQGPYLFANNSSASQGTNLHLWIPNNIKYVDSSLPLISVLSDIILVHALPYYLYKSHFNIGHPSTLRSSKWSFSFDKNCRLYISHRVAYV